MLNFKCMLKCLTEVLTHKTRSLQLFQTEGKKEHLQTNLHPGNIFRLLLLLQ